MIHWIVLGIYAAGYVAMWRTVVWALANDLVAGKPEGEDVVFALVFGSFFTTFWPIIAAALLLRRGWLSFGGHETALGIIMPRAVRREQELRERQKRIEQLERELGVGQ